MREKSRPAPQESAKTPVFSKDENKIYGLRAVQALFRHRREAIVKMYVTAKRKRELNEIVHWCSDNKKAFKVVDEPDLERLAWP